MPLNLDLFKKIHIWLAVIPLVLIIGCLSSLLGMLDHRQEARTMRNLDNEIHQAVDIILAAQAKGGQTAKMGKFDPIASARECAKKSDIEGRLTRASSSQLKIQKDGSSVYRENYILSGVRLLQAAQFIDHAERNYANVRCTQLTFTPVRGAKDSWDINVDLEYRKE